MKLQTIGPRIGTLDTRTVSLLPKRADPAYQSAAHREWREVVITRAGGRCEAITKAGRRCLKAAPRHRMFADHKRELRDGGAPLDPANGECLCGSHHTAKTARARADRR
jgi:hypothetical protein